MIIEEIRKNAGFLNENYENLSDYKIYEKGTEDPNFDFKKGFNALLEKAKNGEWIFFAGRDWETFDFKKGFDALLEKDEGDGKFIYYAGREWETFDYDKGFKVLEEIGGKWFEQADKNWPKTYPEKLKDVKDKYKENIIPVKRKILKK